MISRYKLEHILEYARQQKQFGSPTCRIPPGDMVEIMERLLAQPVSQRYKLPDGYKLVPVDPTADMIAAAMECDDVLFNDDETFCVQFGNIYAAMLAAAPEDANNG